MRSEPNSSLSDNYVARPIDAVHSARFISVEHRCLEQGKVQVLAGLYDEAEASFRQAIEHNGDFAVAHSNFGLVRQALGDLHERGAWLSGGLAMRA